MNIDPKLINVDYTRDSLFTDISLKTFKDRYQLPTENSPQDALARASAAFADDVEHAQRLYDYVSKQWFMFSTPILSNGGTEKGLPISCFSSYVEDKIDGITDHYTESMNLSTRGGGLGGYWGDLRTAGNGSKSNGMISFMRVMDSIMLAANQSDCYDAETEVLTQRGWVKFPELLETDVVATVTDDLKVYFSKPKEIVIAPGSEYMISFTGGENDVNLLVTPNHKMWTERRKKENKVKFWPGKLEKVTAAEVNFHRDNRHHVCATLANHGEGLTATEQFNIAFQADGLLGYENHNTGITTVYFQFTKLRKVNRLRNILDVMGVEYSVYNLGDITKFNVKLNYTPTKNFSWLDLSSLNLEKARQFLDEVSNWDAHVMDGNRGFNYFSAVKECADTVQAVASICGLRTSLAKDKGTKDNHADIYRVYVWKKGTPVSGDTIVKSIVSGVDKVYCVEVETGILLVRRNNVVSVCGNTRRGSYAAYLDVTHPEIEEFIDIRDPSGDYNRRCLGIGFHHAVIVTDEFMNAVSKGIPYDLVDPHSKIVTRSIDARTVWKKILTTRRKTGEPYVMFKENANRNYPANLKAKGLSVRQSNLCSEILLATGPDYNNINRTFICCLSSVNAGKFDEWKDHREQMYEDIIRMLDNCIDVFIEKAPKAAWRAAYSAKMTRDLGLGLMGFHDYLQQKGIPFESKEAAEVNNMLFYYHGTCADQASEKLGAEKGYYPDAYDFDGNLVHRQRNATTTAIAPNASSSILCGDTSPSTELYPANAVKKTTLSGSFISKNRNLDKLLTLKGKNTEEVWKSIVDHEGSVQHLAFLTDREKLVFKTAFEVDQKWVVKHAVDRQVYLSQGQSVNVFFDNLASWDYIYQVHKMAWEGGLPTLYYMRGKSTRAEKQVYSVVQAEKVEDDGECIMCQG